MEYYFYHSGGDAVPFLMCVIFIEAEYVEVITSCIFLRPEKVLFSCVISYK